MLNGKIQEGRRVRTGLIICLVSMLTIAGFSALIHNAGANSPANPAFQRTWERTDQPVLDGAINRTWVWGPQSITEGIFEFYEEAAGKSRAVQYYDKSRMEITTNEDLDPDSLWYVTNGLLPMELMSGNMQLGDTMFISYPPAEINVAGDPNDPNSPTYAEVSGLLGLPATATGEIIVSTIDGNANRGNDGRFASYNVTAEHYVSQTGQNVASVFWDIMNSEGPIQVDGQLTDGRLFPDPFFATGFPVTAAYWTNILVEGMPADVLIQVFERRVMTYTPSNDPGWLVETGNAGQHYYDWRYRQIPASGLPQPPEPGQQLPVPPTASPTIPAPSPAPTATATSTVPACSPVCDLTYGLGEIGIREPQPLGENTIAAIVQPYADLPVSTDIDEVAYGRSPTARLNWQKTFSVVSDWSPSEKVVYIADFNDGTAYIGEIMDAHLGLFISHTWNSRGTFWVKVWALDPETGIRTEIKTFDITVD